MYHWSINHRELKKLWVWTNKWTKELRWFIGVISDDNGRNDVNFLVLIISIYLDYFGLRIYEN